MSRRSLSRPARPTRAELAAQQTDLFPEQPIVDVLQPRERVGPRTGVLALLRVRLRSSDAPHLVFHDRHGWYCEEHGALCAAVRLAQEAEVANTDVTRGDA